MRKLENVSVFAEQNKNVAFGFYEVSLTQEFLVKYQLGISPLAAFPRPVISCILPKSRLVLVLTWIYSPEWLSCVLKQLTAFLLGRLPKQWPLVRTAFSAF